MCSGNYYRNSWLINEDNILAQQRVKLWCMECALRIYKMQINMENLFYMCKLYKLKWQTGVMQWSRNIWPVDLKTRFSKTSLGLWSTAAFVVFDLRSGTLIRIKNVQLFSLFSTDTSVRQFLCKPAYPTLSRHGKFLCKNNLIAAHCRNRLSPYEWPKSSVRPPLMLALMMALSF